MKDGSKKYCPLYYGRLKEGEKKWLKIPGSINFAAIGFS